MSLNTISTPLNAGLDKSIPVSTIQTRTPSPVRPSSDGSSNPACSAAHSDLGGGKSTSKKPDCHIQSSNTARIANKIPFVTMKLLPLTRLIGVGFAGAHPVTSARQSS